MWFIHLLLVSILTISFISPAEAASPSNAELIVKSSPYAKFGSRMKLDNGIVKDILQGKKVKMDQFPELPYAWIELNNGNSTNLYIVSFTLNVFHKETGSKFLVSPKTKEKLQLYIHSLNQTHFGSPLSWREANILFPRKAYADVVDMETGLQFRVQRRAGSQHADVQPLTAKDTKIMKTIYSGQWNWNRRAILLRTDEGHTLAASMHGMPHGAGAIRNNNFPGHFCIHFKESTTHKRSYPDPGHDLMISKASGHLYERIVGSSPEELIALLIASINEQDESLIKLLLNQEDHVKLERVLVNLKFVEGIRIRSVVEESNWEAVPFMKEIHLAMDLQRKGKKPESLHIPMIVTRGSLQERWKVELQPMLDIFD